MANFNHIDIDKRDAIEKLIKEGFSFSKMSKSLSIDRTSIAKEIKRNRYVKSYFYEPFDILGINDAVSKCDTLKKPPYVCNKCHYLNKCNKHKVFYRANIAQNHYDDIKSNSRKGINIPQNLIDEIEASIVPLIKDKHQSINQVYAKHNDILFFSKPTFYKYVNNNIFSLKNIDLPKKVSYKARKNSNEEITYKRKLKIQNGRRYEDYVNFITSHPKMNLCQMDTVIGSEESKKCLLTLIIVDTNFMFIRLLDDKTIKSVNIEIDKLKEKLGIKLFSKVFRIVLTDNGTEFLDPYHIEYDYSSNRRTCNVFYCKPYSSWQKGCIEKNHEYIRKFFPKGTSFDSFTVEQIQKLENTINNIPRSSLNNKSPYECTLIKYPNLFEKLDIQHIDPDDISISKKYIVGDYNE